MSVRRLSKGSNVSLMEFESDDEMADQTELPVNKGLNGMTKRRSSLGGSKSKLNPTEQTRIAEMYKTVIKLAAENKITAKNSWNLELIDHMGSLIKEDSSDKDSRGAVNFQKASCTLDASVKIYSHRVDDTWSSSFRILENLSRGNNPGEEEGEDGVKNPARVGTKSVSNRLNLTATIEKNISNLNGEALDLNHSADPMFHKMSQAFDEGGAKGMLMANLRVVPNSSCLVFTSEGAVEPSAARNTAAMVDVTDLILHSGFSPLSLADVPVAAALGAYRDAIGVQSSTAGLLCASHLSASRDPADLSSAAGGSQLRADSFAGDGGSFHCDDDDSGMCDMFEDDMDGGGFDAVNVRRSSIIASPHRDQAKITAGTPAKSYDPIYNALGDEPEDFDEPEEALGAPQPAAASIMIPSAAAAGNEYSYFDATTLQNMGCNWAGARHWKRALRTAINKTADAAPAQKETAQDEEAPKDEVIEPKKAPSRGAAKAPSRIDFSQGAVDVSSLLPPRGKRGGDPTCQTAGSIDKAMAGARAGALLLPHDAQFTAKDLCRLFLRPRLIVPPSDLKEHLQPALMRYSADSLQKMDNLQSSSVSSSLYGEKDFVWGSFAADVLSFNVSSNEPALNMNQNNAGYSDGFDDDQGLYEGFGEDEDNDAAPDAVDDVVGQMQGLSINNNKLLQATRVVQKVDIGYATVAKRVNVKKLKHDLWHHLEDCLVPEGGAAAENKAPAPKLDKKSAETSVLSFQDVITDISHEQQQKDVSLSFYFICLLHLANEKNLDIKAVESMSDLKISKLV